MNSIEVKNVSNSQKVPFNLEAYVLHSEKRIEVVLLELKCKENLPSHKNPFDVVFYVIEGSGTLEIDGVSSELHCGDLTSVSSEKSRAWKNNGTTPLRLLVMKLPC